MEFKDIAPWLSIVLTFVVAILVPWFTQMSNNRFQLKKYKEEKSTEKDNKKRQVYCHFIKNCGMISRALKQENLMELLTSITGLYAYAPQEWWEDIDNLYNLSQAYEWEKATPIMLKLCKLVSEELQKMQ